jgi:F0F1-type ATP synthase assembly protein I
MAKQKVTVRRAPKLVSFVATGFILGVVVAAFVGFGMPTDPAVGAGAAFGFFAIMFSLVGMGVGAVVAPIIDRSTKSHPATAEVVKTTAKKKAKPSA